ncbi:hypothetical protein CRUP_007902 [Coryphaenoides rupestris]|nr:hypothetical protein CRUP_007902 [Coryphaenoides rupestris]
MKDVVIQGVERFDSPGKGRGLRVTRAVKVGELIFSCPAYCCVLSAKERGSYCEYCFTRKEGLARCGKCKKACYCNATCQLECSAMVAYGPNWCPSETVRLVARILATMVACNGFTVEDEELSHMGTAVACNGFTVEDEELSHMGTAVYPDVALINHSCLPSVTVTFKGTAAEVRAVTPMKRGDEDKAKLKVRKRSQPYEPEVVSNMVRYACKKIAEFRALLEMCVQSLDEMGAVFDDGNVYMLHMMYQAMGVVLYPAYSLNVSSMYLKLGRLYMGLEKRSQGLSALKKAMAIMEVAHGKDHPYLEELRKEIK